MKKDFLSIRILHGALCLGSLLFFLVIYFVLGTDGPSSMEGENLKLFKYLVPGLIVFGIIISRVLDRNKLAAFKGGADLTDKVNDYKSRVILRSALIEGPTLLAVVVLMLNGDKLNALYFGIGWLAMLYVRPYLAEFSKDYKLSAQEAQEMQKD